MRHRVWTTGLAVLAGGVLVASSPVAQEVVFREPASRRYVIEMPGVRPTTAEEVATAAPERLRGIPDNGGAPVWFGSRVVVQVESPKLWDTLLAGSPLRKAREIEPILWILEAPDAVTAVNEAARLGAQPGVRVAHPVRQRLVGLHSPYAPAPNDQRFSQAWHLENRSLATGEARGEDVNVRAAWPSSTGEGVIAAVVDNGIEITHADLAANAASTHHYNFHTGVRDGRPMSLRAVHGTAVAGLLGAVRNNHIGAAGIAPEVELASWVVFDASGAFVNEEQSMDMFQHDIDTVAIQNHSWGNVGVQQLALGVLEDQAIEKAVTLGRGGRGVILVRAAGNDRASFNNVNDDGYAQDPRVIAVGAVRENGQVTSYSTPGAAVLVAGLSGDDAVQLSDSLWTNYAKLFTTDRSGSAGYNLSSTGDQGDYLYSAWGFSGTSAATPVISGVCALILAANPELTYRDVQQILALSARQRDPDDPDLQRNGAGFWVSHHTGFGVPDAGVAVALARRWVNRPPPTEVTVSSRVIRPVTDDGLRVEVDGLRVPSTIQSIPASPVDGLHPRGDTDWLPLVDVGQATDPIKEDLTGKAALIQRGGNFFAEKLRFAVEVGAALAIIYNNTGGDERLVPNGADVHLVPIPAVFIGQAAGEALAEHIRFWMSDKVRVHASRAVYELPVDASLICEHVRLRVTASHPRRGDLRITLVSPSGTRSVMQRVNLDNGSPLNEWAYYSVLHFFEPTAGTWRVEFIDEQAGLTGSIRSVELTLWGVPISDTDDDGLDDFWELQRLKTRHFTAEDDPDLDGATNAREQIIGSDPLSPDQADPAGLLGWTDRIVRLTWPGREGVTYRLRAYDNLGDQPELEFLVPGVFPETSWFGPAGDGSHRFFSIHPLE